jgi:hypothetical protein
MIDATISRVRQRDLARLIRCPGRSRGGTGDLVATIIW